MVLRRVVVCDFVEIHSCEPRIRFHRSDVLSEHVLLELLPKLGNLKEFYIYYHPIPQISVVKDWLA